ncbi:MAG: hypothetical protein L0387_26670 [Acidobacteria bacterium]|nr:hypothetical protein [Acidobacteriota bacterium]
MPNSFGSAKLIAADRQNRRSLEIGHFGSPPRLRRGGRWHRDGGPGASAGVVRPALAETSNRTFRAAKALARYETLEMTVLGASSDHPHAAARPLSLRGTSPPDLRRGAREASNSQRPAEAPVCATPFYSYKQTHVCAL